MSFNQSSLGAKRITQAALALGLAALFGTSLPAQNAANTSSTAIQPPLSPALSSGTPALTGTTNPTVTNGGTTNLTIGNLAAQLERLQTDLDQLLPLLTSFNNSFDFVTTGGFPIPTTASGGAANFSSNLGANFSSSLGTNFSTNLATPTGSGNGFVIATNTFGFPPGLGVAPITRETLRALLVLQSDLQRIQPTLNTLNGGTTNFVGIGLAPGFVPGAVTNVFGITQTGQ
jgi:hypothetical protein